MLGFSRHHPDCEILPPILSILVIPKIIFHVEIRYKNICASLPGSSRYIYGAIMFCVYCERYTPGFILHIIIIISCFFFDAIFWPEM
jgi:hypothetical protein